MRPSLIVLIVFVGCAAPDDRVQRNGGGVIGGVTNGGGGSGGGSGSTIISGRVCVASDLRNPTACAATAPAGTIVSAPATGASTATGAGGTFTLETGEVGGMILDVGSGSQQVVPTIVRVDVPGAQVTVPIVNANDLTDLETGLNTTLPDGMGLVALHLTDANGAGALGFTVTPPPGTTAGPFFDDTTALGFSSTGTATGAAGTALLIGVPQGSFDVAFTNGATNGSFIGVPIVPGHVTFANSTIGTP